MKTPTCCVARQATVFFDAGDDMMTKLLLALLGAPSASVSSPQLTTSTLSGKAIRIDTMGVENARIVLVCKEMCPAVGYGNDKLGCRIA